MKSFIVTLIKYTFLWWFYIPKWILTSAFSSKSNSSKSNMVAGAVATYVAATKIRKALTPPSVVILNEEDGYFVKSLTPKGLTEFKLTIGKKDGSNIRETGHMTIDKNTTGGNAGGSNFKVYWS